MRPSSFFRELKRRHVYRVAVTYAVVGWLLIQAATQVFPVFSMPNWTAELVVLLILIGFPIALLLAWAFDATPQGIVRTEAAEHIPPHHTHRAGIAVGVIGVLLAALTGIGYWHWHRPPMPALVNTAPAQATTLAATSSIATPRGAPIATHPIPAKSVAVLPFESLSEDKNNAYFAAGMQDMILTKLADIGDLKVIARTSTAKYASHPEDLKTIGQQLGVAAILEGSVQKSGNQVLINVQLIDANTDAHLWAESYQRNLDNIFGVEGEVAQQVSEALQARLLPAESYRIAAIPTKNSQAWDLYLKGLYYLNQVDAQNAKDPAEVKRKAAALFDAAVAADPDFALAYAKLSYLESHSYWRSIDTSAQALQTARDAAERALALQPDLPEAHMAMGYVHYWGYRDYAAALAEFSKARTNLPNNAQVLVGIAFVRRRLGKMQEAIEELQQAAILDPQDTIIPGEIVSSFSLLRRYDEARAASERLLVRVPDDVVALLERAAALMMSGDTQAAGRALAAIPADDEPQDLVSSARFQLALLTRQPDVALAAIEHAPAWISGGFDHSRIPLTLLRGQALMMKGDTRRARAAFLQAQQALESLLRTPREQADAESHLAIVYAGLGEKNKALEAGRRATEQVPLSRDAIVGAFYLTRLAKVEAQVGETSSALRHIGELLAAPCGLSLSVETLQLDPAWDPIRHDPRFQALLKKYGGNGAAASLP